MSEQLEIERKYLIAMPDTQALRAACSHVYEMEQTYSAAAPGVTARVRRRQEGEKVEYFYTGRRSSAPTAPVLSANVPSRRRSTTACWCAAARKA